MAYTGHGHHVEGTPHKGVPPLQRSKCGGPDKCDSCAKDAKRQLMRHAPKWIDKHPCANCDEGYGRCAQGWVFNTRCCATCAHPSRWEPNPWTSEDLEEMRLSRR